MILVVTQTFYCRKATTNIELQASYEKIVNNDVV